MSSTNSSDGQNLDDFCESFIKTHPWDQPGYNAQEDPCNPYEYIPSKPMSLIFLVLFSLFTTIHLCQTVLSPQIPPFAGKGFGHTPIRWAMLTVTAGGILQILGWAGRVWSSHSPDERTPFIIQTCTLIIGPSFFSAAIYTLLGWVIVAIEQPTSATEPPAKSHSLLKATRYVGVFVIGDVFSLVLQAIGGGIAATAASDDKDQADLGTNIMEAGIVFQLVVTIIFGFVSLFFFRSVTRTFKRFSSMANNNSYFSDTETKPSSSPMVTPEGRPIVLMPKSWKDPVWFAAVGIALETSMIIFRGIYRTVELAQGWSGFLITHENFLLLDSIPMALCMLFFFVFHPHWSLPGHAGLGGKTKRKSNKNKKQNDFQENTQGSNSTLASPAEKVGRVVQGPNTIGGEMLA